MYNVEPSMPKTKLVLGKLKASVGEAYNPYAPTKKWAETKY